ncbi:MAG: hypothetical protein P1U53_11440 [Sulfitobacter sp.]|nr:hypothetical protein [Sulfitobacter sp.]
MKMRIVNLPQGHEYRLTYTAGGFQATNADKAWNDCRPAGLTA